MSKLTDAIRNQDITTALELINGTTIRARIYKFYFDFFQSTRLLEANESIGINQNTQQLASTALTPLQLAAKYGLLEIIDALLTQQVSIDAICQNQERWSSNAETEAFQTPLHISLAYGDDAVAMRLIEAGANVTAYAKVDPMCFNELILPKDCIFLAPNFVLDGYLRDYENYAASLIFIAVERCKPSTINELARKGAKISSGILQANHFRCENFVDYGCGSILMRAIQTRADDDVDVIDCLLGLGADPNKFIRCRVINFDNNSISYAQCYTALSLAIAMRKVNFAKALILHGATLWPSQLCTEFSSNSKLNWFEVRSEIIASAQQLAAHIGLLAQLQRPGNYPDRYGRIQLRTINSAPNMDNIVPAEEVIMDADNQQPRRSSRFASILYNRYLNITGRVSNQAEQQLQIPIGLVLGEQRPEEVAVAEIVDSMTPRVTF